VLTLRLTLTLLSDASTDDSLLESTSRIAYLVDAFKDSQSYPRKAEAKASPLSPAISPTTSTTTTSHIKNKHKTTVLSHTTSYMAQFIRKPFHTLYRTTVYSTTAISNR
jgi:hypothetical protein